jgi:uncharacterized protein YbjT (DUF2867 family)
MRVALIGGTGLVGSLLAARLLAAGHEVHMLQRRAVAGAGHPLRHEHVAAAAGWPRLAAAIAPDAAVSALGTTMRLAGSHAAFRTVDHDHVLAFAQAVRGAGARRFVTVSSTGADAGSRNFYLRTKGETDEALAAMGFDRLDIFRPGLLRGPRGGERRLGERVGILLSPLLNLALRGPLDRYAAIDAERVAAAIAAALGERWGGVHVHENRDIRRLARA